MTYTDCQGDCDCTNSCRLSSGHKADFYLASNFINEPQSAVVQTSHLRGVRRVLLSDPGSLTVAFKVSFKPWPVAVVAWMACIEDSHQQ